MKNLSRDFVQKGFASHQQGDLANAKHLYQQALDDAPDNADAWYLMGMISAQQNDVDSAVASFESAIAHNPKAVHFYTNLGLMLKKQGKLAEAQGVYERAISEGIADVECYFGLANALVDAKLYTKALVAFQQTLLRDPNHAGALLNSATTLQLQRRYEEAKAFYEVLVAKHSQNVEAWYNYANCEMAQSHYGAAIGFFEHAIALNPQHLSSHLNRAMAIAKMGDIDSAIEQYKHLAHAFPGEPEIDFHRASLELLQGNFAQGWPLYEARLQRDFRQLQCVLPQVPRWNGEPLGDKTLIIIGEQGVGEEILFASLLGEVCERVARVQLAVDPRLVSVFARSFPGVSVICRDTLFQQAVDQGSLQLPMGSLPLVLKKEISSDLAKSYLKIDPSLYPFTKDATNKRIGIAWNSMNPLRGANKSIPLREWHDVLSVPGCEFYSLQYGDHQQEIDDMHTHYGVTIRALEGVDPLKDVDSYLAAMASLDLVISTPNAAVDIAGAIGQQVWVLLEKVPDFRWLLNRDDSMWYPRVQTYRQTEAGEWPSVMQHVSLRLKEWLVGGGNHAPV